jgi:hypothetical protein
MKNAISICIGVALALGAGSALAQAAGKPPAKAAAARAIKAPAAPEPEAPAAVPAFPAAGPENTLDGCRDGIDNDLDGHVDCADQDCWIYAMCVPAFPPPPPAVAPPPPAAYVAVVPVAPGPERWHQCKDGVDNNNDGLTDCFEPSCQRGSYCRREMYYVPEPEDKAPGLLLSLGLGLALPNYRRPAAKADSARWGEDIPFDPDVGGMVSFDLGYLPVAWFGLGARFMGGISGASNRPEFDTYDDNYKYNGYKGFGHAGGFLRFQYPAGRFVPSLNIAAGYSYARFQWDVYDGREYWSDIDDHYTEEHDSIYYASDRHTYTTRHFTMALEPGADFFVRQRSLAVGVRLWLPVFALPYSESSTDNVGLMFSLTYLPSWRERPKLKPQYEQALTARREASAEPAAASDPQPPPGHTTVEPMEWEPEPVAPAPDPEPEPAAPDA